MRLPVGPLKYAQFPIRKDDEPELIAEAAIKSRLKIDLSSSLRNSQECRVAHAISLIVVTKGVSVSLQ